MNKPRTLAAYIVLISAFSASADDWPTHLHDNQRTGKSSETLSLPLKLQWRKRVSATNPAWPKPAKQDYWNRKLNLRPRVVHDRSHGIVASNGRLMVSSSSDDQVRAFNAATGEQLWTSFAEGPIRLAPTIWNELVVFAADDGFAYGVDAKSGALKWKIRPPEVGTRRIPGNGRLISERPIRSGVMINEEGTGYFVAGIFPKQGAYFYSIDAQNGELIDQAQIQKSVQGYLEMRDGQIFAPTGRDPEGTTLLGDNGKLLAKNARAIPDTIYSMISDTNNEYYGGEGQVVAMRNSEEIWKHSIDGRAYSMAIADGQLFVSTDSGWVYAFGSVPVALSGLAKRETDQPASKSNLQPITDQRPGYVLFVNPRNDEFEPVLNWVTNSRKQVVIAMHDKHRAADFRTRLSEANVYGKAVVHLFNEDIPLNYAKNIFHRLEGSVDDQLRESLSPYGGTAEAGTGIFANPLKHDSANWTHAYGSPGNTAASKSRIGGEKLKLQWFGGPGPRNMVDRHMRTMPPLVSRGRMYIPGLNRIIVVDAFTGLIQWEEEIPDSTRIGMLKDCGWMAIDDDKLYVAVNDALLRLQTTASAHTKSVVHKVPFPGRDWGYLACIENRIVGSSTLKGAARRTVNRAAILEGAYSDNRPIVCSDALFAFDATTNTDDSIARKPSWQYKCPGAILNPTIAATPTSMFFVENELGDLESTTTGRVRLSEFWRSKPKLVSIDLKTGKRRWTKDLPDVVNPQNAYVLCDDDHVILVNSRNAETVHYDVRVFQANDGQEIWTATQDNLKKAGGDHGEQDKHPVLVGSKLIVEPLAYDLDTGAKLTELNLNKRGYGCGTLSASAEALFFRSGNPASYSLKTNSIELVTAVSRPNCWINMIPAEGLLLIPEGSSGCTCNSYPVQTSMAFTSE